MQNSVEETHYDVLSVSEAASHEEIRRSYRSAILSCHPDKLRPTSPQDSFFKVHKAWEVLSDARSRAVYDSQLRASRQDVGFAEDVNLDEMMVEDGGDVLELYYQCRCGDYFSVDSLELKKLGYVLLRRESGVSFEREDGLSGSVVIPCGSCSLQIRLLH